MNDRKKLAGHPWAGRRRTRLCAAAGTASLVVAVCGLLSGCGVTATSKKQPFFTSGSQEANQRADQYMAKQEQLADTGEGAGQKKVKPAKPAQPAPTPTGMTSQPAQAEGKLSLYERLGSEEGIAKIVADFIPRALNDPRVNWERKGVKGSGWFGLSHKQNTAMWQASPQNVAMVQKHMVQFLALATGGPVQYNGGEIKAVHANMGISNPEFDAVIGDLKASLDKLRIPNLEQKELLAIVETTRPLIVTER